MSEHSADANIFSGLINIVAAQEPLYFILIEKSRQRLQVLEYDDDLKILAEYPIATGENPGHKKVSGDSRTPEGIYFITRIFKDSKVTIFGDRAFHLDYPNFFDRQAGRNGDGIFIHGTNRELQPNSSNGCVVLCRDDLHELARFLQQEVTPVIITPEITPALPDIIRLKNDDYRMVKSLILPSDMNPVDVEFKSLYLISVGSQTVAVGDFTYRPFIRSAMQGTSRTYLEYLPTKGWTAGERAVQVSPLQIYPEMPGKVLMLPMSAINLDLLD